MALVGEAKISGEPREFLLAASQALERAPDAEPHPVARDRVASHRVKNAAEVVG